MNQPQRPSWIEVFTRDFILAISLFFIAFILFSIIADQIVVNKKDWFDSTVFEQVNRLHSPSNNGIAIFITSLGTGIFLIPTYLLILFWLIRAKHRNTAALVASVAFVSLLLSALLKNVFQRARPPFKHLDYVAGYSFPSGHSMVGFTFCGIVMYLLWTLPFRKIVRIVFSIIVAVIAILIGLSRIYLNVHFASDVLGSLLVNVMWLSLCFVCVRVYDHRKLRAANF
ncbi:phosphatase PAP2 family protein [Pinibacter soli]|uniref:Phosphatase PAP2 family protein n=1 Tax=Pinibacter soli TaxID=3044211 RepID=A0ABT6RDC6_9BACT|nr:phosphatase PAP2 family protein [Pinibacter soli]MDI3320406.1 phosphatase PAP2 family protein [Pinibacter soli]